MTRLLTAAVTALVLTFAIPPSFARADDPDAFHYTPETVDTAAYWAALSNLANAVMFSGLGEEQIVSPYERDDWLRRAGYVVRPAMPDMPMVGVVYAGGTPRFAGKPDFGDPATLVWQRSGFDKTLAPAAHAWTLIKIASPEFHLQFHDIPGSKMAGLMMLPQARTQAKALFKRMRTESGLFAAKTPNGRFLDPRAADQAAVLWGVSNLILAATGDRDDYWHSAYRKGIDPGDYRDIARAAFDAVKTLPPITAQGRAVAIAALGRYAAIVADEAERKDVLLQGDRLARELRDTPGNTPADLGFAIYGLIEAGRLFADFGFEAAGFDLFRDRLVPLWDERLGVFREGDSIHYTPTTTGGLVAALNAIRWYGPEELKPVAEALYPQFLETVLVEAGLLQASPLALVAPDYLKERPKPHFAHPKLPDPVATGTAPVFASEVARQNGAWTVTDSRFHTAGAMLLTNMLAMRSKDGADTFFTKSLLARLR